MRHPVSALHRALAFATLIGTAWPLAQAAEPTRYDLHISASDLDGAMTQFADQAGLHLLFNSSDLQGLPNPGLQGSFTAREALQRLLEGSGVSWTFTDEHSVLLQRNAAPAAAPSGEAQSNRERVRLDAMQIQVASRTPTQISAIPGTVWVVEQKQLREQLDTGVSLKEALGKLVPGLDLGPEGRTNYGQNMRGRGVLVMIDGVSQNSSRGLSRQFDSIAPFNVERVEVLSGASALYGGGATGGIINIVTRKGEAGPARFQSNASVTSGFNNSDDLSTRLAQAVSGGNERVQGRLGVSLEKNEAFYDADGEQVFLDNTQTDLQYNRSVDVLGNLAVRLDDTQQLDLLAQYYDSGNDGSTGIYFPNLNANAPSDLDDAEIRNGLDTDLKPRTRRTLINASYRNSELLGQDFYLQGYYRREDNNFHPFPYYNAGSPRGSNGIYFAGSQQNFEVSGLKGLFSKQWDDIKLTYGLDLDHERFNATQKVFDAQRSSDSGGLELDTQSSAARYPSYVVDGLSAYAQLDWQLTQHLSLSAGARQQHMDVEVGDFRGVPGGSNDYEVGLYNLGALYDFANGHQLWSNYSEGFELADPAKYYGRAGLSVADNPLTGIKSRQVEVGWRFNDAYWQAQAAFYYIWSDKVINTDSATLTINVDEQKSRDFGFEAALSRDFDSGWQAGTTLHLVRSEEEDDDGDWIKRDARYASLSKTTAFVGWSDERRSLRLQGSHAMDLSDDAGHRIEGYTTFDLSARQDTDFGTFSAGIQNLLDRRYSTVWGQRAALFYSPAYGPAYLYDYQGRGRTFTLGYEVEF